MGLIPSLKSEKVLFHKDLKISVMEFFNAYLFNDFTLKKKVSFNGLSPINYVSRQRGGANQMPKFAYVGEGGEANRA